MQCEKERKEKRWENGGRRGRNYDRREGKTSGMNSKTEMGDVES